MGTKHSKKIREPFEHPNVSEEDWRLYAATSLSKPAVLNGSFLDVGTVVKRTKEIRPSRKGPALDLGAPNITALLLDIAMRFQIEGADVKASVTALDSLDDRRKADTLFFDALEKRMGAAVFAFTAVESFANEIIERAYGIKGYCYHQKRKDGLIAALSLETVQRKIQIEEKIGVIVPDALGIQTPKGRTPYNNFKRLKDLRDRIIHCKGFDQGYSNDSALWNELLHNKSSDFATQMYDLIGYFYEKIPAETPRWYRAWPW